MNSHSKLKYILRPEELNEGWFDDAWSWAKEHAHILLPVAEIGAMFVPVIGPLLAAGIGLADAALYAKEGDKTAAAVSGVFSVLPGIGAIASKIPAVKALGKEGMGQLGKKIAAKDLKSLSAAEKEALEGIGNNQKLVKQELANTAKQGAANRFSPATCAIRRLGESTRPLNESGSCGVGHAMVNFCGKEPQMFLSVKEKLFTKMSSDFANIRKLAKGEAGVDINAVLADPKKFTELQKKLNQLHSDVYDDAIQLKRGFDLREINFFGDMVEGQALVKYRNIETSLSKRLADGEITKKQYLQQIVDSSLELDKTFITQSRKWDQLKIDVQHIFRNFYGDSTTQPKFNSDFT